jgi:hypothetical protein
VIVGVAILKDGVIYALPRPARHSHLSRAYNDGQRQIQAPLETWQLQWSGWSSTETFGGEQGFVDHGGRFLSRADAASHALASGQIAEPKRELFSEDVW